MMKIIYKYLFNFFGIVFIILVGLYIYGINSWRNIATEAEIEVLIKEIKSADELPDKFYKIYEINNPTSLDYGIQTSSVIGIFKDNINTSPSLMVSRNWGLPQKTTSIKQRTRISYYGLASKLENKVNQKECLNWIANNHYFENNQIGIFNASKYYFNKEISNLTNVEMATLVLMIQNASLYNPIRNPEGVQNRVSELLMISE